MPAGNAEHRHRRHRPRRGKARAVGEVRGDELIGAKITHGDNYMFLASHRGQAIRFREEDVRPMGRQAYGVWGIRMEKGDYLVGMATTPKADVPAKVDPTKAPATDALVADLVPEKGRLILSVTENGYGKRTLADEYRLQGRGGSGVINVKTTERNGKVVGIAQVTEKSEVMLISQYGKIIRMDSTTIRESGRAAQGVRLLNLEPGDRVAAAVVLAPGEEPTNGATLLQ